MAEIYAHLNSTDGDDTGSGNGKGNGKGKKGGEGKNVDLNDPSAWGQSIREDGQGNSSLFVRDLGNGRKVFTFVIWAQ